MEHKIYTFIISYLSSAPEAFLKLTIDNGQLTIIEHRTCPFFKMRWFKNEQISKNVGNGPNRTCVVEWYYASRGGYYAARHVSNTTRAVEWYDVM